jgi:hypothetical protein
MHVHFSQRLIPNSRRLLPMAVFFFSTDKPISHTEPDPGDTSRLPKSKESGRNNQVELFE